MINGSSSLLKYRRINPTVITLWTVLCALWTRPKQLGTIADPYMYEESKYVAHIKVAIEKSVTLNKELGIEKCLKNQTYYFDIAATKRSSADELFTY